MRILKTGSGPAWPEPTLSRVIPAFKGGRDRRQAPPSRPAIFKIFRKQGLSCSRQGIQLRFKALSGTENSSGVLHLPSRTEILPLLPGLRRFAAALAGRADPDSLRETDERVLRAVHTVLRDPLVDSGQNLRPALYGALVRLQQGREELKPAAGPDLGPALLALPFGHRAALLLVVLEGFSYEEAATALGLNRHIVLGRLTTARQMLSRHFDARQTHGFRHARHLRLVK